MVVSRKSRSIEPLRLAVAGCLDRHATPEARLVVGLSGGVDSVVLLHMAMSLRPSVEALHVNHGLSAYADNWTTFCRDLCRAWSIPLHCVRVDVERDSSDGLEAAARRARHRTFEQVEADWILLGHHRGDRAETMLFNLLRGASVRGAGAMTERRGRLLRPLLEVGRSDITSYAADHRLQWIDDHSNADIRFSRNFLRHSIIPAIANRFPAVEKQLANAAERFAEAADLLDDLARVDLGAHEPDFPLDIELLANLPEPRARNVLRYLFARHGIGIPSDERLTEALRQSLQAAPDRHPSIEFGQHAIRRKGGRIVLEPR